MRHLGALCRKGQARGPAAEAKGQGKARRKRLGRVQPRDHQSSEFTSPVSALFHSMIPAQAFSKVLFRFVLVLAMLREGTVHVWSVAAVTWEAG